MPKPKKNRAPANTTAANVGYEAELWQMADALRGSMDAAEYKQVVLGLIFLQHRFVCLARGGEVHVELRHPVVVALRVHRICCTRHVVRSSDGCT